MNCFQIDIIKGDSLQKNVSLVNVEKDSIDKIYVSSEKLGISQALNYNDTTGKYEFYLSPQETSILKEGLADYDITIKFKDDNIKTVVYQSTINVHPKKNKVGGLNE